MHQDLELVLCEKHRRVLHIGGNLTRFGFECGDGWYSILDALLECITTHIEHSRSDGVFVTQVKEKYGSLRIYTTSSDPVLEAYIDLAESLSERTCDVCGRAGTQTVDSRNWIRTRCKQHDENTTLM